MIIQGTLRIPEKLKSLGKLIKQAKEINASDTELEDLGDLDKVVILDIINTQVTSLGKLTETKFIHGNSKLKKEAKEKGILK
jgi:hypothetical protein